MLSCSCWGSADFVINVYLHCLNSLSLRMFLCGWVVSCLKKWTYVQPKKVCYIWDCYIWDCYIWDCYIWDCSWINLPGKLKYLNIEPQWLSHRYELSHCLNWDRSPPPKCRELHTSQFLDFQNWRSIPPEVHGPFSLLIVTLNVFSISSGYDGGSWPKWNRPGTGCHMDLDSLSLSFRIDIGPHFIRLQRMVM